MPNLYHPYYFDKVSKRYLPFFGNPVFCKQFACIASDKLCVTFVVQNLMNTDSVIFIPFISNSN